MYVPTIEDSKMVLALEKGKLCLGGRLGVGVKNCERMGRFFMELRLAWEGKY